MSAFNIYTLNTAEQLDLFYSEDEGLNLEEVARVMRARIAPITSDGHINGEGFLNPSFEARNEINVLEAYGTALVNLGNYFQTTFSNDSVVTEETQYNYYSKARVIITNNSNLILKFDNSTEEKAKSKIKALIEDLGFEANIFKIDNELLRKIQNDPNMQWSAAKIDRIDKDGDKTTKVSYEIDLADDVNSSQVDENYRDYGKLSHLKFEIPYLAPGANDKITINLYNNGHRIYFEESELGDASVHDFIVYLMDKLKEIKEG